MIYETALAFMVKRVNLSSLYLVILVFTAVLAYNKISRIPRPYHGSGVHHEDFPGLSFNIARVTAKLSVKRGYKLSPFFVIIRQRGFYNY